MAEIEGGGRSAVLLYGHLRSGKIWSRADTWALWAYEVKALESLKANHLSELDSLTFLNPLEG